MPLIDAKCRSCERVHEQYRSLAMFPATHPCPDCGGDTVQVFLPKAVAWTVDPVLVFKAPDGSFRFPGDSQGLSAKNYEKQGFERVEIRGAAEMRKFESTMNKREYSRMARQMESKQEQREAREKVNRSELRRQMESMSSLGRDVARAAMARNDGRPVTRTGEPGFVSEVFSYDKSNREDSRGSDGRRRRS